MTTTVGKTAWSPRNVLIASIVLSVIIGAVAGYAASSLSEPSTPAPQDRTFFLFTTALAFNETQAGLVFHNDPSALPHDYFAPDRITVNKGDRVFINYYNTEEENEPENHTFTMTTSPYVFNYLVLSQHIQPINFTANVPGVFQYICTLHQPTMTGYLVVLGS